MHGSIAWTPIQEPNDTQAYVYLGTGENADKKVTTWCPGGRQRKEQRTSIRLPTAFRISFPTPLWKLVPIKINGKSDNPLARFVIVVD